MTDPLSIEKITNNQELITVSAAVSASKGWHEQILIPPQAFALIHSEISEALEAFREDYRIDIPNEGTTRHWWAGPPITRFKTCSKCSWKTIEDLRGVVRACISPDEDHQWVLEAGAKPVGFASEIADVVIRVADFFGRNNLVDFWEGNQALPTTDHIPTYLNHLHDCVSRASFAFTRFTTNSWDPEMDQESMQRELSSVVGACFHLAEKLGFDLWAAINNKTAYNKTRSHRHGGKVI